LAFRDDKNVGSPRMFIKKIPKHLSSKYERKEDAMLLATGFATVSQIANHCQIPCCVITFYHSSINKYDVTRLGHKYS